MNNKVNKSFNLTTELMESNAKIRNSVKTAHKCYDSKGNYLHNLALYSHRGFRGFTVTKSQINEATKIYERQQKETLTKYENVLLFDGAGMPNASSVESSDIDNPRIRTRFINDDGKAFYLELGTSLHPEGAKPGIRCDHSVDLGKQAFYNDSIEHQHKFYNCMGLEKRKTLHLIPYTKENILELVNDAFNCSFENVVIDNHNLNYRVVLCVSPGYKY